ncbi:MAG: DegT/DnrJ/EryC1/StrS family aminotransferase [Cyclobacteriaceae bacterium]
MHPIRMVDLHTQYEKIKPEVDAAIARVLESTAFIKGPEVEQFEQELGAVVDAHVVSCANGTDALQIAMMALGFQPGDEVILPVHTYVATAEVIALLRLKPVFVDVDERSFNINVEQIERAITKKTVAIVPVHLYGQCADMEPILQVARQHNLHVIEDAAQALGAQYTFSSGDVQMAGTMGIVGSTSFFPSKNLGCFGDGGALFTRDADLAARMRMVANHGQKVKYHHDLIGINSRLDTLQAAILRVKLKHLAAYTQARNKAAAYYDQHVDRSRVELPWRSPNSTHVFHQYTIKSSHREELQKHLERAQIPTMIYYPVPLHLQKAYRQSDQSEGSFPVTEELSRTVLSLPIHTEMTSEQLAYICHAINAFS